VLECIVSFVSKRGQKRHRNVARIYIPLRDRLRHAVHASHHAGEELTASQKVRQAADVGYERRASDREVEKRKQGAMKPPNWGQGQRDWPPAQRSETPGQQRGSQPGAAPCAVAAPFMRWTLCGRTRLPTKARGARNLSSGGHRLSPRSFVVREEDGRQIDIPPSAQRVAAQEGGRDRQGEGQRCQPAAGRRLGHEAANSPPGNGATETRERRRPDHLTRRHAAIGQRARQLHLFFQATAGAATTDLQRGMAHIPQSPALVGIGSRAGPATPHLHRRVRPGHLPPHPMSHPPRHPRPGRRTSHRAMAVRHGQQTHAAHVVLVCLGHASALGQALEMPAPDHEALGPAHGQRQGRRTQPVSPAFPHLQEDVSLHIIRSTPFIN